MTIIDLGSITGNDPAGYNRFANYLGAKPALAHLYFDQRSSDQLWASIPYICAQAKGFIAAGAQILWSVPCPGAKQLEAIVAGTWDWQYTVLFQSALAASPVDGRPIYIRLPWEFNLAWQENAALDHTGAINAPLFVQAWQHLATMARSVSPRFHRIWCPNVCTNSLDPLKCWPGLDYVEIITQDFYMEKAYDQAGFFHDWFLTEARGLQWCANFAHQKGKPYGFSEWGMDSDIFVNDFIAAAAWLKNLKTAQASSGFWNNVGGAVHHHCWWDRSDGGIDCRISDGTHPKLAMAYKELFSP